MAQQMTRISEWAHDLTEAQAKKLLAELVYRGIETEDISFYIDALAPYCAHSGDPLVEGQKKYPDEE